VNGDGARTFVDAGIIQTIGGLSGTPITDSVYQAEADLNRDGSVGGADLIIFQNAGGYTALPKGDLSDATVDDPIGYSGYYFDEVVALYHVRYRYYDTVLMRWLNRDPAGYVDSMSLYGYGINHAIFEVDAFGLSGNYFFATWASIDDDSWGFDPSKRVSQAARDLPWAEEIRREMWDALPGAIGEEILEQMKDPWFWVDVVTIFLPGVGKAFKWIAKGGYTLYKVYRAGRAAGRCACTTGVSLRARWWRPRTDPFRSRRSTRAIRCGRSTKSPAIGNSRKCTV